MAKQINLGGINGSGEGLINTNSEEYKALKLAINSRSEAFSKEEKIKIQLLALKLRMQDYVKQEQPASVTGVGGFLREHLEVIGVKQKDFARYTGIEETNLSAILNGRRKINSDFAIKLGQIFKADSNLWLMIQNKNELIQLVEEEGVEYGKFGLEDLLKSIK